MEAVRFKSKVEQAADYIRMQIARRRWTETIPGRLELAKELGVNNKTVEDAIRQLEREHVVAAQGSGKRRRITMPDAAQPQSLRLAVLLYEPGSRGESYIVDLMHQLADAGHVVFSTDKTLLDMGMRVSRVAKLVEATHADAWVVLGGSRQVLQWFSEQSIPVFAVFGRRRGLPIAGAGPDKPPAMRDMTTRLIELGHKRIVLLARKERRVPVPGTTERSFLSTLEEHGIQPSAYHLPDWEESPDGFQQCLEGLFRLTPPTALIVDEAPFYTAAMQFFSKRGIRIPEELSLLCCDYDPAFSWCKPTISHIHWDTQPVVKRIVSWARATGRGRSDRRQTETKAQFIEGGTIAPAPHPDDTRPRTA